ncbi:hypothetical protein ACOSZF_11465 [Cytobacillus firmus]|uniref:hypothetical protein n=1 Tax=Cytobacillus firmus TaxID=1399 RepID=UPI00077C61BD|nr:hypothetical protein [Cytobacillus firmus]MBG9541669.1 hypothetical protein [Cytobacillus firmus]MBG9549715.1 hypothetical protein [Cytobacillus firmus]MBG9553502.1 hypothetical protein [Cytobacillus firmus]MBG9556723.1 hypothetical protein [Cytobacillus firmus]MBG9574799.1 hypothetical protein [Cytobacillus firmus]
MKKLLFLSVLFLCFMAGCSNQQEDDVSEENDSHNTTEELRTWADTTPESIQTNDGSTSFYGEVGQYGVIPDTFRIDQEGHHVWYMWIEPGKKDEMIGKQVTIKGINEKAKGEEILLGESEITELSSEESSFIPDSQNVVKFEKNITPNRTGKWKLNTYADDSLLGTTVVTVLDK